jgi:hypothetical protein
MSTQETDAAAIPPYRVTGHQGLTYMIVVAPEVTASEQKLWLITDFLLKSSGKGIIQTMFWTDSGVAPDRLPMTTRQVNTQVAQANINENTGHREIQATNGHQFTERTGAIQTGRPR